MVFIWQRTPTRDVIDDLFAPQNNYYYFCLNETDLLFGLQYLSVTILLLKLEHLSCNLYLFVCVYRGEKGNQYLRSPFGILNVGGTD